MVRNYSALIDGLVVDGVWQSLDALYIFATNNSTNALQNLVSNRFLCIANGSPTFTANQGYTGTSLSTTVYLNTQMNPATAAGRFSRDSGHISFWGNTEVAAANECPMGNGNGSTYVEIHAKFGDGNYYCSLNDSIVSMTGPGGVAAGHSLVNRSGASAAQFYRNASSIKTSTEASSAMVSANIYILARNNGSPDRGTGNTVSAATIGASLTAANVTALHSRLGTFRTAVGL